MSEGMRSRGMNGNVIGLVGRVVGWVGGGG